MLIWRCYSYPMSLRPSLHTFRIVCYYPFDLLRTIFKFFFKKNCIPKELEKLLQQIFILIYWFIPAPFIPFSRSISSSIPGGQIANLRDSEPPDIDHGEFVRMMEYQITLIMKTFSNWIQHLIYNLLQINS